MREQISYEIEHDTKHSDREANSPCFAEGSQRRASVRGQTDSREEVEEGGEVTDNGITSLRVWQGNRRRSAARAGEARREHAQARASTVEENGVATVRFRQGR